MPRRRPLCERRSERERGDAVVRRGEAVFGTPRGSLARNRREKSRGSGFTVGADMDASSTAARRLALGAVGGFPLKPQGSHA